jgi:Flp pilus assembly protein TadB
VPARFGDDAAAMSRRDAAPDVEGRQRDADGPHPAGEHVAQARHARILVVVGPAVAALSILVVPVVAVVVPILVLFLVFVPVLFLPAIL